MVGCDGRTSEPTDADQICCKKHALEWAQDRADQERFTFNVWWMMGSNKYLVRPDGQRPATRHVVREATVNPR